MSDKLTMQEAIAILGVTHLRFYKLREIGLVPDGVSNGRGGRMYWSRKIIESLVGKINKTAPSTKNSFDLVLATMQGSRHDKQLRG